MERGVLAQMERDGRTVWSDLPAFGQFRFELREVVGGRAVGQRLDAVGDQAVVDIPGHFVRRHVGVGRVDVERGRPFLRDDDQGFRSCLG